VGGDGPVEALFDEYVVAFFGAHSHDGQWASRRYVLDQAWTQSIGR
jgi:hypothetical protein